MKILTYVNLIILVFDTIWLKWHINKKIKSQNKVNDKVLVNPILGYIVLGD